MQIGKVYVASCQPSTISSIVQVHVMGAEIGYERVVDQDQDDKRSGLCIDIRFLQIQGRTNIESCVSSVCMVQEQYKKQRW